jgi:WD40 repeat protein
MGLYYQPEKRLSSSSGSSVLAFRPGGDLLAEGGAEPNRVSLWDTATGTERYRVDTHASPTSISWSAHTQLHCGLADGYLLTVILDDESKVSSAPRTPQSC